VSATRDWDAHTYDRVSTPQVQWAEQVLGRLELRGDETVLDAGCGSGRVTAMLLERLPRGRVVAVDASPSMIDAAREALPPDRVQFLMTDLVHLSLDVPVDAVFSNAVFHWIADHDRLFATLHAALRPDGQLVAQCGGEGNVAEWVRAIDAANGDERFAPYLRAMPPATHFASVADTESRLRRAGFDVRRVWLYSRTYEPRQPRDFVRSVGLAKQLERLPSELHDAYVDAVLGSMPRPLVLHYVRLNISATRPA
jgi:trans-aconitate 2-methyltransferase